MFWCDWGSKPKIEMSDMDGTNRVVLINTDITWPNGLAIDIYKKDGPRMLYWTDASLDKIETFNIDTKERKVSKEMLWHIKSRYSKRRVC